MTRINAARAAAFASALLISVASLPAAEALLPAAFLPAIDTRSIRDRGVTPEKDPWNKRWKISLAPLVASQSLDAASSYGMRELNPVLAGPDGAFGGKATALKFGVAGGLLGVEYILVRKFPRSARFFTIVNWTTAGATTGLAIHNYRLPGR